jgi:nitrate reductase NapD
VHHTDPRTGRIIVTQEGRSVGAEVEGLQRIKALPDVILAEMVHHHFEEDRELIAEIPSELQNERPAFVPPRLED